MMDAEERALTQAIQPLLAKLKVYAMARPRAMDGRSFQEIGQIVDEEAVRIQQRTGQKLPKLVAIVLPSVGWIGLVRADMEHAGIQAYVRRMIKQFEDADTRALCQDLVAAIHAAFPDYKPSRFSELGGISLRG